MLMLLGLRSCYAVLLGLFIVFLAAKLGGFLAVKLSQPAVLGELIAGVS